MYNLYTFDYSCSRTDFIGQFGRNVCQNMHQFLFFFHNVLIISISERTVQMKMISLSLGEIHTSFNNFHPFPVFTTQY